MENETKYLLFGTAIIIVLLAIVSIALTTNIPTSSPSYVRSDATISSTNVSGGYIFFTIENRSEGYWYKVEAIFYNSSDVAVSTLSDVHLASFVSDPYSSSFAIPEISNITYGKIRLSEDWDGSGIYKLMEEFQMMLSDAI